MRTWRQPKRLAGKAALRMRPARRAAVLEGLALWLSDRAERELARYTAGRLRQSEEIKLYERLTEEKHERKIYSGVYGDTSDLVAVYRASRFSRGRRLQARRARSDAPYQAGLAKRPFDFIVHFGVGVKLRKIEQK